MNKLIKQTILALCCDFMYQASYFKDNIIHSRLVGLTRLNLWGPAPQPSGSFSIPANLFTDSQVDGWTMSHQPKTSTSTRKFISIA